jgi:anti-anti-sigma regulatory factor
MHALSVEGPPTHPSFSFTVAVLREEDVRPLRKQLPRLLDPSSGSTLRLDLSEVRWVTAAGMGELVKLHNGLRAAGRELVLYNVKDSALEVFEVVGLTGLLDIRPDEPNWRPFAA